MIFPLVRHAAESNQQIVQTGAMIFPLVRHAAESNQQIVQTGW